MSDRFEVPEPIICSPYDEPAFHWRLEEGREPEKAPGRRPSHYFYRDPSQRSDRRQRLFFAQLEAVETIIFLTEGRHDLLQGLEIPIDEPSDRQKAEMGYQAFRRYACKMATGSGKTTVMALLAAWSILNKVHDRSNARYSDVVLVVCPNVTIRSRLGEVDPQQGEASM